MSLVGKVGQPGILTARLPLKLRLRLAKGSQGLLAEGCGAGDPLGHAWGNQGLVIRIHRIKRQPDLAQHPPRELVVATCQPGQRQTCRVCRAQ